MNTEQLRVEQKVPLNTDLQYMHFSIVLKLTGISQMKS